MFAADDLCSLAGTFQGAAVDGIKTGSLVVSSLKYLPIITQKSHFLQVIFHFMLNNANIFSICLKYPAFFYSVFTIQQKGLFMQARGAWITDIDDTLVESGKMPTPEIIQSLTIMVRELKKQGILWVPMSGVAMVKMGPRILYNLPEDILDNIIYYAGDGSQKYFYDPGTESWREDEGFVRLFSDGQALAVLGLKEFKRQFSELADTGIGKDVGKRLAAAAAVLKAHGIDPELGLLNEMKEVLKSRGFHPEQAETYFRGGRDLVCV